MEATGIYEILPASIVHTRSGVDTCVEKMGSPSFVDLMISSFIEPEQSQQKAEIFKRFESFMMTKTKVRMLVIYEHGLVEGKLVLGTTDKTEAEIGFACNLGNISQNCKDSTIHMAMARVILTCLSTFIRAK